MKITVLRPPKIDPSATTPPPGRVLRFDGDAEGLAIDNEARRPWSAVRFLTLFQRRAEAPLELLLLVDGRRRPFDCSTARFSGAAFEGAGGDPRQVAVALARHAPRLVLDRSSFETLRGAAAQPPPADPQVYLAAVQAALGAEAAPQPPDGQLQRPNTPAAPAVAASCPHCGHGRPTGAVKCDRCGVIFAKLERPADDEVAATGRWPADDEAAIDDDTLGLGAIGESRAATSRWGEAFLGADGVAAAVIGILRGHGVRLVMVAAAVLSMWLVVGSAAFLASDAWLWRAAVIGLGAAAAYSHGLLSLSAAIHAVVNQQDWRPRSAFGIGLGRLPWLLPVRMFGVVTVFFGLAAFIVPGFVFALRTVFVETIATIEGKTPEGISWGQVSSNLGDGFRFAVAGHLFTAAGASLACLAVPAFGTAIAAWLELVQPATWVLPSVGLFTVLAIAVLAAAAALTVWASALYVLCRELQDRQGLGLWNAPSGLSAWARAVLIIDLFMVLVILVRASKLDS